MTGHEMAIEYSQDACQDVFRRYIGETFGQFTMARLRHDVKQALDHLKVGGIIKDFEVKNVTADPSSGTLNAEILVKPRHALKWVNIGTASTRPVPAVIHELGPRHQRLWDALNSSNGQEMKQ